jgi:hypothetical protein
VIQDYPILKYYLIYQHLLMLLFNPLSGNAPKFIILLCLTPDYFTLSNARRFYWVFRRRRPTKTKTYENEDQRPKMGLRNYENEDPLRKRRPIFIFVITKTKTHYENEDPSLFSYYENEDPLRKRRPIFVFVLRKRRP